MGLRHTMLAAAAALAIAKGAGAQEIHIDRAERMLYLIEGADTTLATPVAVGRGETFTWNGETYTFETPAGDHTILAKQEHPMWRAPDWHYKELAARSGLKDRRLVEGDSIPLSDGTALVVDDGMAYRASRGERYRLPNGEHPIFDGTIFIPPLGPQRDHAGALGAYKLAIGDGYLLHGTPHASSFGRAVTHGCVRVPDDALSELYRRVPVGARVRIR